jgi:hypothetical protein
MFTVNSNTNLKLMSENETGSKGLLTNMTQKIESQKLQIPASEYIQEESGFSDVQGYQAFVANLARIYRQLEKCRTSELSLIQPEFSEIKNPEVLYHHQQDYSSAGIMLRPSNDQSQIITAIQNTQTNLPIFAPLILRDVSTLQRSPVGQFNVIGEYGNSDSFYSTPKSLRNVLLGLSDIDKYNFARFSETTTVVRLIALLPKTQKGIFKSEFVPRFVAPGNNSDECFAIWTLAGDKFSSKCWLTQGRRTYDATKSIEGGKTAHFEAISFNDMSEFEQFLAPGQQSGHLVLAACPYKREEDLLAEIGLPKTLGHHDFGQTRYLNTPSQFSRTDIQTGSTSGKSTTYNGKLLANMQVNPIIFDFQIIAVEPELLESLDSISLSKALRGSYSDTE